MLLIGARLMRRLLARRGRWIVRHGGRRRGGASAARAAAPHAATKTVYVAAQTARCVGVVPLDCLQVRTAPNEPWQLRHGGIEGFDYRPGDAYLLEIAAYRTPNPPADGSSVRWVLERVVRRQPRQARRRAAQRETNTRAMRKRHMRNA